MLFPCWQGPTREQPLSDKGPCLPFEPARSPSGAVCRSRFVPSSPALEEKLCSSLGLPAACLQEWVEQDPRGSPGLGAASSFTQAVLLLWDKQSVCLGTRMQRGLGESRGFGHLCPGLFGLACSTAVPLLYFSSSHSHPEDLPRTHPCKKSHPVLNTQLVNEASFLGQSEKLIPWLPYSIPMAKTPN